MELGWAGQDTRSNVRVPISSDGMGTVPHPKLFLFFFMILRHWFHGSSQGVDKCGCGWREMIVGSGS